MKTDIEQARLAIATLRDWARFGGLDHFRRDPLVMILHNALDELEALAPLVGGGEERRQEQQNDDLSRVDREC